MTAVAQNLAAYSRHVEPNRSSDAAQSVAIVQTRFDCAPVFDRDVFVAALSHDILLPGGEKDEHGNIVTFVMPSINDYVKLSAWFYALWMAIIFS